MKARLIHMANRGKKAKFNDKTYDSITEKDFSAYLFHIKAKGIIKDYKEQVTFQLIPTRIRNGETIHGLKYVADFVVTFNDDTEVVIDVKGTDPFDRKTPDYLFVNKIKNLMEKYPDTNFWLALRDKKRKFRWKIVEKYGAVKNIYL